MMFRRVVPFSEYFTCSTVFKNLLKCLTTALQVPSCAYLSTLQGEVGLCQMFDSPHPEKWAEERSLKPPV